MIRRAARRLGWSLVVFWLVLTAAFLLQHTLGPDPARAVAGQQARPEEVQKIRQQLGLARPLRVQYLDYLHRLAHLGPSMSSSAAAQSHAGCISLGPVHVDLGTSYQRHLPVLRLVSERLMPTVLLALAGIAFQLLLGIPAGVFAALRKGRLSDTATIAVTLVGVSAPTFVTALLLQYWGAYRLRIFPLDGFGNTPGQHALALVLPALALGLFGAAFYARIVRDEVITLLAQDHVKVALGKGIGRARLLSRHVLRVALIPLVTIIGMDLGALMGGAVVTETIFRWPGMGSLMAQAVAGRDVPVVMGVLVVAAMCVIACNLLVDALYGVLDPRIGKA